MPRRRVVGVMGAGTPSERCARDARELGRLVAEAGWVVLTGGRPNGVMAAAAAGAKEVAGGLTLGIIPSAAGGVGSHIDLAVFTGMGDARNVINVLSSDVVVACGVEGPGTASEVALALKAEKPVILLGASAAARDFFHRVAAGGRLLEADTPSEAIRLARDVMEG